MKKFIFFLFIMAANIVAYSASNVTPKLMESFKKYEMSSVTRLDYPKYLKQLVGDTIIMEFNPSAYLTSFTVENPDTVWIKKKPKKNPVLGKHYVLNKAFKGVSINNEFVTPASAINGKPFAVYSVNPTASYGSSSVIQLLDLETLDLIRFVLYDSFPEEFKFTTTKTHRLMTELEGQKVYYCPDMPSYSVSSPQFTECTFLNGDFYFEVSNPNRSLYSSSFSLKPYAQFRLKDKDDNIISFSPIRVSEYGYKTPVILTTKEYQENYMPLTINSEVDFDILNEDYKFPFSFVVIPAKPNYYASVYQKIDPSSSYSRSSANLNDCIITIGDRVSVKGTDYYKACYNGKAFFIKTKDVKLLPEGEAQVDSLVNCSQEVRDKFFLKTLAFNKSIYLDNLGESLQELKSYAKYGLAIPRWGVYDMSEYTDGTGIRFTFYNPTNKVIKYVSVTFQGYNAVDDPVGKAISKRCIGPIDPDETASYDFEYAWFSDVVEYAKIRSLVVQYKDGTSKTISNPKTIMFSSELKDLFYKSDPVKDFN